MKRFHCLTLTGLLVLGVLAGQIFGQSAEEIFEKMAQAKGEKNKLDSVNDMEVSGRVKVVAGGKEVRGQILQRWKKPTSLRIDLEVNGRVYTQSFDGDSRTGWYTSPMNGNVVEMSELEADTMWLQALYVGWFLNPIEFVGDFSFASWAYKEKKKIRYDSKEYIVIEGGIIDVIKGGIDDMTKTILYIDSTTYLLYRVEVEQKKLGIKYQTYFSLYNEVDGIEMPFDITEYLYSLEGTRWKSTMCQFVDVSNLSNVRFNVGLEDSIFKMEK